MAEYFKEYTVFEKSGRSFLGQSSQILQKPGETKTPSEMTAKGQSGLNSEEFKNKLKKAIDEKLQGLKEHLMVDTVEGGVRIQLVDTEGKPMFRPGGAELSASAKEILRFLSDNIKDMPNKIAVEGHTDSSPLQKEKFTNWELSTERASSARRELEVDGIDINRVARVVGYADTELLFKNNPTDSRNRRISIILMNEKVAQPTKAAEPATTSVLTTTITTTSTSTTSTSTTSIPAAKPSPGQEKKKPLMEPIVPKGPIDMNKPFINPGQK